MNRFYFWFKLIGAVAVFITLPFIALAMIDAQEANTEMIEIVSPPEDRSFIESTKDPAPTVRIKDKEIVYIYLSSLSRGLDIPQENIKSYIFRVSNQGVNYDFPIPNHQRDSAIEQNFCGQAQGPIFKYGKPLNNEEQTSFCLGVGDFHDTIILGIDSTALPCTDKPGNRCKIELLRGNTPILKHAILEITGKATPPPNNSNPTPPTRALPPLKLAINPTEVDLGEPVTVTITDIPVESALNTFLVTIDPDKTESFEITTATPTDQQTFPCTARSQEDANDPNPWERYNSAINAGGDPCDESGGKYSYSLQINTANLRFNPDVKSAFPYTVRVLKNGNKEIAKASFSVDPTMKLILTTDKAYGNQTLNTENIQAYEKAKLTAALKACPAQEATFKLYKPESKDCALSNPNTCEQNQLTTPEFTASVIDGTGTFTHTFGNEASGTTYGLLAICGEAQFKSGTITFHQIGDEVITITGKKLYTNYCDRDGKAINPVVSPIPENCKPVPPSNDERLKNLPVIDPQGPITFNINGLQSNQDCYVLYAFKDGVKIRRPYYLPSPPIPQGCNGDYIDDPIYAFHVFQGTTESYHYPNDVNEETLLKSLEELKTDNPEEAPAVLFPGFGNGAYRLDLYRIRDEAFLRIGECRIRCGNDDQLEASSGFVLGSATLPPPPFPPCESYYRIENGVKISVENMPDDIKNNPQEREKWLFDSKIDGCDKVSTAFFSFSTDPREFIGDIMGLLLSISGGIAVLLIIRSGYQLMTSQGNPDQIKEARERITSAVVGLLFLIFSLVILEIIGVDILKIPGFCDSNDAKCVDTYAPKSTRNPDAPTPAPGSPEWCEIDNRMLSRACR